MTKEYFDDHFYKENCRLRGVSVERDPNEEAPILGEDIRDTLDRIKFDSEDPNEDKFWVPVRRLDKGTDRPFVPARQRAELIAALECVDFVVMFGASTPLALIKQLRPDVLAKGGDWAMDEIVGAKELLGWGGEVRRLREVPGIRTTLLARKIRRA